MPVAEAQARISHAEFLDWLWFFEWRRDVAEHGPNAVEAMDKDDDEIDHATLADRLEATFTRMERNWKQG